MTDPSNSSTRWSRRESRGVLAAALAILLGAFVALTVFVTQRPSQPSLATDVDRRLRAYPGAWRYVLANWFRAAGSAPVVIVAAIVAAVVVTWVWQRRDLAVLCVVAPLLAGLAELAIKTVLEGGVSGKAALAGAFGAGFPSGHTAGITAIATSVAVCACELFGDRRVRLAVIGCAVVLVAIVAASSVVGGAHRSLDVVGGVLLGVAAALAVSLAVSTQPFLGTRSTSSIQSDPQ